MPFIDIRVRAGLRRRVMCLDLDGLCLLSREVSVLGIYFWELLFFRNNSRCVKSGGDWESGRSGFGPGVFWKCRGEGENTSR